MQVLRRVISWGTELRTELKAELNAELASSNFKRTRLKPTRQKQTPLLGLMNAAIVGLLALTLLSSWVPTVDGRVSLMQIWRQQMQQRSQQIERLGNVEVMPVRFEGRELFTLAAPTVWDRGKPTQQLPVEVRATQVEANLNRVIEGSFLRDAKDGILTNFDPKTMQVSVVSLNDVPVIIASDSYHLQPLKLVTVTYIDADYNAQPVAELAEQWRSLIYQSLYSALLDRSPDALRLRGKLGESLLALALMLGASLVIRLLQIPLRRRNRHLRMQQTALIAEHLADSGQISGQEPAPATNKVTENDLLALRSRFVAMFEQLQQLRQQRQVVGFFRWQLAWGQVVIWLAGLSLALGLFPWTRQYLSLLAMPIALLAIWFGAGLVNRLTNLLLQGMASAWVRFGTAAADAPLRDELRVFTVLSAVQPLKSFVVYATGLVVALVYLGLPLSLVLCVSGVVGLAVLLICQGFVRDWAMGLLILWEDQYAVGDLVTVAGETGLVEHMNLRLTQIQTAAGRLISIANGSLTKIENLTRSWLHQTSNQLSSPQGGSRASFKRSPADSPPANPFSSSDPFDGIDPLSPESSEVKATEG